MRSLAFLLRAAVVVTVATALCGCAADLPPPAAMLAPSPPGWFVFCAQHGGRSDRDCDPVPAAAAMTDGGPASSPPAWRAFCRRHPGDVACA